MGRVLVTGSCGFVGSHLVRALRARGDEVLGVDALLEQVHGPLPEAREKALKTFEKNCFFRGGASLGVEWFLARGIAFDAVVHLAARVGVGQSQYERAEYTRLNTLDTDRMLDTLAEYEWKGRLVVASSMSVYGEGSVELQYPGLHTGGSWVPRGSREDDLLPTVFPNHYALTKFCQEQSSLGFGECHEDVTATSLRFFNIYGEGQSLSNPYTGVAAMFAARLLHGKGGLIYEDGGQRRDYIHVSDVVDAIAKTLDAPEEAIGGQILNVCTGEATPLVELHHLLAEGIHGFPPEEMPQHLWPVITGTKRKGDIRNCFGSPEKAERLIGFKAKTSIYDGMRRYASWLRRQDTSAISSRVEDEYLNLKSKGLIE